jgi:hypothetical protein
MGALDPDYNQRCITNDFGYKDCKIYQMRNEGNL